MTLSQFFDSVADLEWLAILVGTVAMFITGWLWYGPLFGKTWVREHGITATGDQMPGATTLVKGFLQFFALNIGIAYFIPTMLIAAGNDVTVETITVSAFVLAFFVIAAAFYGTVVYLRKSVKAWTIDSAFYFIGIAIAAYVQSQVA
mgnify:CR=1 FL=1